MKMLAALIRISVGAVGLIMSIIGGLSFLDHGCGYYQPICLIVSGGLLFCASASQRGKPLYLLVFPAFVAPWLLMVISGRGKVFIVVTLLCFSGILPIFSAFTAIALIDRYYKRLTKRGSF